MQSTQPFQLPLDDKRIGIDPAHLRSAAAWVCNGVLYACGLVDTPLSPTPFTSEFKLIVEVPVIRDGWTPNVDDVLKTRDAAKAWQMLALWREVRCVEPNEWKGTQKKPKSHRRLWAVLTPAERQVVAWSVGYTVEQIEKKIDDACRTLARTGKVSNYSWSAHNVLDAVGIVMFDLGRFVP